jgi:hypothetical protein
MVKLRRTVFNMINTFHTISTHCAMRKFPIDENRFELLERSYRISALIQLMGYHIQIVVRSAVLIPNDTYITGRDGQHVF